jgi:hypothetical protein
MHKVYAETEGVESTILKEALVKCRVMSLLCELEMVRG